MKKIISIYLLILLIISSSFFIKNIIKNEVIAQDNEQIKYIYLDPGHGGIDVGGSNGGILEKDINLKICKYLKSYLENCGYYVLLTRDGDYDLANKKSTNRKYDDINKRLEMINNNKTLLYISIHCNIYTNSKIRGAQTFYNNVNEYANYNELLAKSIQEKLKGILKNTNRMPKNITNKYLIDNANKCGCLVEVGFLSNYEELNLLIKDDYQQLISYAIYLGIINFLSVNNYF